MSRTVICFSIIFFLFGCATTSFESVNDYSCQSETLTIDADFERGAFAACKLTGEYAAQIEIRPEPRTTNNSAWYAFRVQTDTPAPVTVTMRYKDGSHRYWPKVSSNGEDWEKVEAKNLRVSKSRKKAVIEVQAMKAPLFVAAQPLDTLDGAIARIDGMLSNAGFTAGVVGQSGEGRPIPAYENISPQHERLIVILARQHPPETTGAVAFEAFIMRLAEADDAAVQFRNSTAIFIAPMINPDGFVNGHWRGNAKGYDLNRDWGPFATPEVSAIARRILELSEKHDPVFFADFHSTQRTVIYAAPIEMTSRDDVSNQFFEGLTVCLGAAAPEISRSHKSESTTSKAWSLETLGVAGFTYEVADDADLEAVARSARAAAEILMEVMAKNEASQ